MHPFRTTNVPAAVAEVLRRQITGGELRPGDRLPGNRAFAAAFGVSMGSIREATSML
jgi:DNA-binding FadR family transcriptional regulator